MMNPSAVANPRQVRLAVTEFCEKGQFDSAYLLLIQSGFGPEEAPDIWEYLARRCFAGGEKATAHNIRRALWDAGIWTADTALKEADHYLQNKDFSSSAFMVNALFGPSPENAEARLMLARSFLMGTWQGGDGATVQEKAEEVLELAQGLSLDDKVQARTSIDLLRYLGRYELALERNDRARSLFPDDIGFVIREARIRERRNELDRALEQWEIVAQDSDEFRVEALFRIIRIGLRLDRSAAVMQAGAILLQQNLPISKQLELALIFEQQDSVRSLVQFAASGGSADQPIDSTEAANIAEVLLNNGDIGLVVWLRRARLPIGKKAIAVLDACGFHVNGSRHIPNTFAEAAGIRSPDFLLPLNQFFEQEKRPAGWPGIGKVPNKILLVNASLVVGGAERQFVSLVRSLVNSGIRLDTLELAFFSLAEDRGHAAFLPELQDLGVTIHDLSQRPVRNRALPAKVKTMIDALPVPLRDDTVALWHLANTLRPNVIHGWQDKAALACGIVGQILSTERVIMSARNMSPATRKEPSLIARRELYKALARVENFRFTANSAAGARDYETWLGCPEGTFGILTNTIDTTRFAPAAVKRAPLASETSPLLITGVFRLVSNKRPQLWLRTMAALRHREELNITPRICGRGPLYEEILKLAEQLGMKDLQIRRDASDPEDLYSQTDAMLLMSQVEGVPNVILEAQACGIPVAACDVGGVREALHLDGEGSGLLMAPDITPERAAEEIAKWLRQDLTAVSAQRIQYVENRFGPHAVAHSTEAFYRGLPGSGT